MTVTLPLDEMTTLEKLEALERIWSDLSESTQEIASPAWHEDELVGRQEQIDTGQARFVDIDQVKERIRSRLS
ncbi:addiction module protein [Guyparkeria sp. 1SP6A2]|nr:addiction module protein [Guyparkeria sp. 1SP6A2]